MKRNVTFLMTMFLVFIIAYSNNADQKVNGTESLDLHMKTTVGSMNKSSMIDKAEPTVKSVDQVSGLEVGTVLDRNNSSREFESREVVHEHKEGHGGGSKVKHKKEDKGSNLESTQGEVLPSVRKESFRGEECDPWSNSCSVGERALVACLRVPGNESPDLSLLIQNKGKAPLGVTVSGPESIWLEKRQIQLQGKGDEKVKVVRKRRTNNFIILTTRNGNCTLDFRDLMSQTSSATEHAFRVNYINLQTMAFVFLVVLLLIASFFSYRIYRHKHTARNGSKYQKLDMELPVSKGCKAEMDSDDGWGSSWGNNWDDEEAATESSMPITPSMSSRGTASRRFSKEGWKD